MDLESSATAESSINGEEYPTDAPSPDLISTDLGLDPSDPLTLYTAHGLDSSLESSKSASAADWSQLTALWPPQDSYLGDGVKYPDFGMDYNFSLPMTMDYNPSMAVDPSALHFESTYHTPSLFTSGLPLSSEFLSSSSPFPFTFRSDESSSSSSSQGGGRARRLSITSSSSSSGASLSPVFEPKTPLITRVENPVDDLAQRVRQSAGVLLAVPTGVHGQPSLRPAQTQAKLPIPRLPRPKVVTKVKRPPPRSEPSSAASSPPPSDVNTSSPDLASLAEPSTTTPSPTAPPVAVRPKTSHTTIERRYRTNLNARIQSLRQAVPALRVLEDKCKPRKDGDPIDVVDDRGFVDGVKVARKCSKANVLGKAVEYIRVLKRREYRLVREQNGLKSLISGLVGGPALLKEWETEWRANFGGEETDEIEMEPVSEDDDDDDEGDEASKEEEEGRSRKKVKIAKPIKKPKKVVPVPATVQAALMTVNPDLSPSNVVPEKRKRGRPRKVPSSDSSSGPEVVYTTNVLPAEVALTPMNPEEPITQQPVAPTQGQASQYLLATFALFSFFNSPLTQSPPHTSSHSHTGVVLSHTRAQQPSVLVIDSFGWRDLIQAFHLLVSALVFCSILAPWLPTAIRSSRLISYLLSPISWLLVTDAAKSETSHSSTLPPRTTSAINPPGLVDALCASRRGKLDEADQLRSALGISTGLVGLIQNTFGRTTSKDHGFEHKGLVQRAWVRLGELAVLDGNTSLACNLHTYWCMRSHVSWFSASPSDLSTLALLIWRISGSKAASLWSRGQNAQLLRSHEKLVLATLSVNEAAAKLAARSRTDQEMEKCSPIEVLTSMLIRERIKRHAASLFVRTVAQDQTCDWQDGDGEDVDRVEEEELVTIDAAKSLGGRTGELGEMLERVWKMDVCSPEDVDRAFETTDCEERSVESDGSEEGIKALLKAVVLYRRIFPTSVISRSNGATSGVCILLSPPPSPSRKNSKMHLALRRILGSGVFDYTDDEYERLGIALDDARDRVVEMLMGLERQLRGCMKKGDGSVTVY